MKVNSSPIPRKRAKFTPSERAEILEQYRQSGLSTAAFARRRGIGYSTLRWWIQGRRRSTPPPANFTARPGPGFVELSLPGSRSAPDPAPLGVRLPSGIELSLRDPRQIDWAARLIAQLREVSC